MEHNREEREAKQSTAWGEAPTEEQPADDGQGGAAPPGDPPPGGGGEPPAGEPPPGGDEPPATPPPAAGPRRIYRSRDDRVLAGVCGGLGRYFAVDPLIFRIATLVLAFVGGTGILLYLAAALLMPSDPPGGVPAAEGAVGAGAAGTAAQPGSATVSNRALTVIAVVVGLIILGPIALGAGLILGGILLPIAVLALAGLFVWWLVSGQGPAGSGGETARRMALGLGVLVLCTLIAFGGFWAAAVGGGAVVASLIITAGAALMVGAFFGGVRWLILPALALALPVALVAAAGIEMDGGVGERDYRPGTAADVRDRYELGMGSLVVDLREADLPAGDRDLELDVGIGEAVLIVPEDVCVASRAEVGMGAVNVFDRDNGGIDVDFEDTNTAPAGTPRVLVDANVGLGEFQVRHTSLGDGWNHGRRDGDWFGSDSEGDPSGNRACGTGATAAAGEPGSRG